MLHTVTSFLRRLLSDTLAWPQPPVVRIQFVACSVEGCGYLDTVAYAREHWQFNVMNAETDRILPAVCQRHAAYLSFDADGGCTYSSFTTFARFGLGTAMRHDSSSCSLCIEEVSSQEEEEQERSNDRAEMQYDEWRNA